MRTVYVARDPFDAELVKQLLATHGIDAVVQEAVTWIAPTPYPTVAVLRDEDAAAALDLIRHR